MHPLVPTLTDLQMPLAYPCTARNCFGTVIKLQSFSLMMCLVAAYPHKTGSKQCTRYGVYGNERRLGVSNFTDEQKIECMLLAESLATQEQGCLSLRTLQDTLVSHRQSPSSKSVSECVEYCGSAVFRLLI